MPVLNDQLAPVRTTTDGSRPSLSESLTYSAPYLTMAWLGAPIPILQGIYAKYYGFSLTTLASIILLARLFDAITDPLIVITLIAMLVAPAPESHLFWRVGYC